MGKQNENDYLKSIHRIGRIGTIVAVLVMLGIPTILCLVYDCFPPLSLVLQAGGGLFLIFVPLSLSELISYAPILGSGSYITFITGNVTNLKFPVALNALQTADTEASTEKGDAIVTVAVAVSSIVTMLVIFIGILLMVPLQPILDSPVVSSAVQFMLPALLGAMLLALFGKKSGQYTFKNHQLSLVPCVVILVALLVSGMWNPIFQGVFIVLMIPVTVLTAWILYKKKIITITSKEDANVVSEAVETNE